MFSTVTNLLDYGNRLAKFGTSTILTITERGYQYNVFAGFLSDLSFSPRGMVVSRAKGGEGESMYSTLTLIHLRAYTKVRRPKDRLSTVDRDVFASISPLKLHNHSFYHLPVPGLLITLLLTQTVSPIHHAIAISISRRAPSVAILRLAVAKQVSIPLAPPLAHRRLPSLAFPSQRSRPR